ncbi:MAG: 16S rRNA (uracil(1498)-N(3))-methyltransferase [Candidatus Zixiibacteriota bacterium]
MNMIILTEKDRVGFDTYRFTDHRAEHVRMVLKAKPGDFVEIGLLDGAAGKGKIRQVSDNEIVLETAEMQNVPLPEPAVDLICALPRPQTLKKVLFTAACMGVRSMHLIRANRVEKSYFQSPLMEPENYAPFLVEGLSQGKLTRSPDIRIHDRFRLFFEETFPEIEKGYSEKYLKFVADPETDVMIKNVYSKDIKRFVIAVGPEGGWVPFEIEAMEKAGFRKITLGRWLLRVESAVTAVLAQLELARDSGA